MDSRTVKFSVKTLDTAAKTVFLEAHLSEWGAPNLKHLACGMGLHLTASKWLFFLVLLKEPDPSHKFSINGIIDWYNFKSKNAERVCGKHKHVFGVRCKLAQPKWASVVNFKHETDGKVIRGMKVMTTAVNCSNEMVLV